MIPRVPWWLKNPVLMHSGIVFDQNLIEIDQIPIRPIPDSVSNDMFCVEL